MAKILVIHGPNLNLLGNREPSLYGKIPLKTINQELSRIAKSQKSHQIECLQTNSEADIIKAIHDAKMQQFDAIIINPAAFSHTSIAIRDAFLAVQIPFYEVHLTNIYARESYRHISYLSDIAIGVVYGMGPQGYYAALIAALEKHS